MVIIQQSDDFPKLVDLNFGKVASFFFFFFVFLGIASLLLSV